jgi:hypothetical protein
MIAQDMINTINYYADLVGKSVQVKRSDKSAYTKIIGKHGIVDRVSGSQIGVLIDGITNESSTYGVFWFNRSEIKILGEERKVTNMNNFKHVVMVRLADYTNKEYAFALYDEELELLGDNRLVVVNPNSKGNRVIGTITEIYDTEEFYKVKGNIKVTAEVVGVVNTSGYEAREAEKVRLAELAKKKAAIEKELEAEINKRKSIEYYEAMAKEYSDNPKLAELVAELKQLGM